MPRSFINKPTERYAFARNKRHKEIERKQACMEAEEWKKPIWASHSTLRNGIFNCSRCTLRPTHHFVADVQHVAVEFVQNRALRCLHRCMTHTFAIVVENGWTIVHDIRLADHNMYTSPRVRILLHNFPFFSLLFSRRNALDGWIIAPRAIASSHKLQSL